MPVHLIMVEKKFVVQWRIYDRRASTDNNTKIELVYAFVTVIPTLLKVLHNKTYMLCLLIFLPPCWQGLEYTGCIPWREAKLCVLL